MSVGGRHDKSPELGALAQLCGTIAPSSDIYSLYSVLRACLSIGERGWLVAAAIVNVALGGNVPIPDLVSVVPPGYGRYISRMVLVDDKVLYDVLKDVPLPRGLVEVPLDSGEKERSVSIEVRRYPMAFGLLVEYDHPEYGVDRNLWVFYYVGTGDYPLRAFLAHREVADEVARMLGQPGGAYAVSADGKGRAYAVEKPGAYEEVRREVEELARRCGGVEGLYRAAGAGQVQLPEGVRLKHRRSPKHPPPDVEG